MVIMNFFNFFDKMVKNYAEFVANMSTHMLTAFKNFGKNMSLKMHYLFPNIKAVF